ncbi:hypothetical protein OUZ56_029481 [Daphnia magna]|uniref:Uncharacterized protein n=1 Tax=Daphnia magna TaxID=35525 RepID=A0ABR0B6X9_9CRUS|nr:hypothetical protein OUZ56_029481 [Daphnia magna]
MEKVGDARETSHIGSIRQDDALIKRITEESAKAMKKCKEDLFIELRRTRLMEQRETSETGETPQKKDQRRKAVTQAARRGIHFFSKHSRKESPGELPRSSKDCRKVAAEKVLAKQFKKHGINTDDDEEAVLKSPTSPYSA